MKEAYVDEGLMRDSGEFSGTANVACKERSLPLPKPRALASKRFAFACAMGGVAPTLLGHADTDYLLREMRRCAGA